MRRTTTLLLLASLVLVLPALALQPPRQQAAPQAAGQQALPAQVQQAERRIALVIGNAAYPNAPLKNPVNDARDMAATLRSLGFEVIARENASLAQMEGAVNEFWGRLKKGGSGLFYFAGHGLQVNGRNYLVPVDARLEAEQDAKYKCMDAGLVLGRMENAGNELNIIILDACRNNPFARSWRSADVGLAKMDAPRGSIIAYATAPDSVAADGAGKNGLYTEKLLRAMRAPGQPVEQMFKRVRDEVMRDTKDKQVPWESTSLRGDFYFTPGSGAPAAPVAALPPVALPSPPTPSAPAQLALDPAANETPKAALSPLSDLKQRLAGKYAEAGADTGKKGLIFDFALKGDDLIGTPSGWTGRAVTPVGISEVRVSENTLAFRFTYKKGLFGIAGTTYTDYACDLSGGLDVIPMTYMAESGSTGKARLIRLQGTGPKPLQQAQAASPKQAPPPAAEHKADEHRAGEHKVGDTWRDPVTGMEFVWVPGGTFEMGCGPWSDSCDSMNTPAHSVRLSGFWLGKYEVTQGQWQKAMGSNPSRFKKGDNYPVEMVSWQDAKGFGAKMSSLGSFKFRLPTEAEWEYAARSGGREEEFAGSEEVDMVAWYEDNSGGSSHAVGTKAPNGLGLYDMSGNVGEWIEDVFRYYTASPQENPVFRKGASATVAGTDIPARLDRGGSWLSRPGGSATYHRVPCGPAPYSHTGLRLVRVP